MVSRSEIKRSTLFRRPTTPGVHDYIESVVSIFTYVRLIILILIFKVTLEKCLKKDRLNITYKSFIF